MSPDIQEAHSLRYSAAAFFVLPLSSGRIAILTPRRDLYRIVESWEEALVIGPCAEQSPIRVISLANPLLERFKL
jgi:hypothetical protein